MIVKIKYILLLLSIASIFYACNNNDSEPILRSSNVRISAFSLQNDSSIIDNLSTVFFTIDLENGLIYNADSLPKGTEVTKLKLSITTEEVVSAINITTADTTFNYLENKNRKIDLTNPIEAEVISDNGTKKKKYEIKVNVHDIDADVLYWGSIQYNKLPGEGNLGTQRTIRYNDEIYCYVQRNEQYILATTTRPSSGWSEEVLTLNFIPNLSSLQASNNMLYMLDIDNNLYTSADGRTWQKAEAQFHSLIGGYDEYLLAITYDGENYYHDIYPRPESYTPQLVASDFPVSNFSDMLTYDSSWLTSPQGMIIGGRTAQGNLTGAMWGYEGNKWAKLNNTITPREGAIFFQYVTYSVDAHWVTKERITWFIIGGINNIGAMRDVWISNNYGVTWSLAPFSLQLPGYIVSRGYASTIVCEEPINAATADWMALDTPTIPEGYRLSPLYSTEAPTHIPYIYMFGGKSSNDKTFDQIWRAVLNRLTFEPIP